jgi:hypothetical protein
MEWTTRISKAVAMLSMMFRAMTTKTDRRWRLREQEQPAATHVGAPPCAARAAVPCGWWPVRVDAVVGVEAQVDDGDG